MPIFEAKACQTSLGFALLCLLGGFANGDFLLALILVFFEGFVSAEKLNAFNKVLFLYMDSVKLTFGGAYAAADALVRVDDDSTAAQAASGFL